VTAAIADRYSAGGTITDAVRQVIQEAAANSYDGYPGLA
jgi:hypothetical protein